MVLLAKDNMVPIESFKFKKPKYQPKVIPQMSIRDKKKSLSSFLNRPKDSIPQKVSTSVHTPLKVNNSESFDLSKIEEVCVLGKGSFGLVKLVRFQGHEGQFALKCISKLQI